ncbi:L-lactate permease [Shigella flexneri]
MVLAFAFISTISGTVINTRHWHWRTPAACIHLLCCSSAGWGYSYGRIPSSACFAALQATAAQQIGVSDLLLVAANTTGGVTGKMISPQSIAIACAAVGLVGKESDLFRFTVKHSLIFTCMVGVITTLQAYVLTWMIP